MIFKVLGVIFLTAGALFIVWPQAIEAMEKWGQQLLFSDEGAVKHRFRTGIFFLIVGGFMFLFAYWVHQWGLSEFFRKLLS